MSNGPLEGIKVIEWSSFVAAPACARLLGDLGADVVKIESSKGDAWRFYGANMKVPAGEDENPVFDIVNSGKKSIVVDLTSLEGKEVLYRLLENCDVFLTNTRAKSLRKIGLDYEHIHKRFPKLIYATLTGFGETGPEADSPGFDNVAFWGKSGFLVDTVIRTGQSYPMIGPTGVGDMITGTTLMGAICAALFERVRSGKGQYVTASLYGAAIWHMSGMILRAQSRYGDKFPQERSTSNPLVCPYLCSDGEWLMLTILEYERYFATLCRITELEELIEDARYKDASTMLQHRGNLISKLEAAFARRTADEWKKDLIQHNIVCEKLAHFADVENSEQAWANHFLEKFTFDNGGVCAMPRPAIRLSDSELRATKRGPLLGEDTEKVLRDLGYSEEKIREWVAVGAVAVRR